MTHANRHEKSAAILDAISGGKSVRKACKENGVPDPTFLRWVEEDGFSEQYARAMESRADAMFEDLVEIADDRGEDVNRDRLRVDARKWALARMNPKKYGDRIEIDANHRVTVAEEPLAPEEWESQFTSES